MVKIKTRVNRAKKRARQVLFMVMAIALILLGVPFSLHLVKSWNDITPTGDKVILGVDEFNTTKFGSSEGKICLKDNEYYTVQDTIVWGDDKASTVVIVNPGSSSSTQLYWFLNYTVSDLINIGMDGFYYNLTFPSGRHAFGMFFGGTVNVDENYEIEILDISWTDDSPWFWDDYSELGSSTRSNASGKISFSTLDLMTIKAEFGNVRPVMALYSYEGGLDTSDQVSFNISYKEPSTTDIQNDTILKIGALVIGLFLIWVGVASTTWYNPAPGSTPGWLDKKISNIGSGIRRRTKRRRSRS